MTESKLFDALISFLGMIGLAALAGALRTWAKTARLEDRVEENSDRLEKHERLIEKVTDACAETREKVVGMTGELKAIRETTTTELGAVRQTTKTELEAIHRTITEATRARP